VTTSVVASPIAETRPRAASLPFYYGWVNLFVAALAMTATLPGRTHGLGLITTPLLQDLQLDAVFFSQLNFWAIVLGSGFAVIGGRCLDRWGARPVVTLVSLVLGGAVVAMSLTTAWLPLFATLILVRGLGQCTLSVASVSLVGKWFTGRIGPAMGVFSVLLAIGFIASTLSVGWSVTTHGWRPVWSGVGLVLACGLAPLCWLLVRSTPEACGLKVETEAQPVALPPITPTDFTLRAAMLSPAFWAFTLASSLFGLIWSAITLFNQPILEHQGFAVWTFSLVLALLTASGLVCNLVGGWLATRWPLGRLLGVAMLLLSGGLAAFPQVRTIPQLVLYALVLGIAGGLITVVHFAFYAQTFGRTHLGRIQGAAQVLTVLASAVGPLLLAEYRRQTGSYDLLFQGGALLAVLLGTCAWLTPLPRRAGSVCLERNGA